MITIVINGLDEAIKRFGVDVPAVGRKAALVIGEEVRDRIARYPGPAHSPVIWASQKQRRWWFAHRREKGLPFEYTRNSDPESQRLGGSVTKDASWTVQPAKDGAVVGTRVTYAPWVQAAHKTPFGGPQTAQHKATGWVTDEQVARDVESSDVCQRAVEAALLAALRGR